MLDDSGDNDGLLMANTNRALVNNRYNQTGINHGEVFENESNKSNQLDPGTMNVFGFNDDLNHLDDRIIV